MRLVVSLLLCVLCLSCSSDQDAPARAVAIGEIQDLERIADAWREVAESWPSSPMQLPPQGRRQFLEQVFERAGYGYSASLIQTGQGRLDPFNKEHKDLAELLLLPGRDLATAELASVYRREELAAVETIKMVFP